LLAVVAQHVRERIVHPYDAALHHERDADQRVLQHRLAEERAQQIAAHVAVDRMGFGGHGCGAALVWLIGYSIPMTGKFMKPRTAGVLRALADGSFHSGEALAVALGV